MALRNIVIYILQNNEDFFLILLGCLCATAMYTRSNRKKTTIITIKPITMKIIDFSKSNSIINKYMAEMRDKDYQNNRLLFRNNIMRVGELIA